jgi:hypothetical protein
VQAPFVDHIDEAETPAIGSQEAAALHALHARVIRQNLISYVY